MSDYAINVFWSGEDDCYIATVPDLEGCTAFGATLQEAVCEVEVAKKLWLEVANEDGEDTLLPSGRGPPYCRGIARRRLPNSLADG